MPRCRQLLPACPAGLERIAAYVLRPPLSLKRLTYKSGSKTAVYRTLRTLLTGANFLAIETKELIVRLLCLVPSLRLDHGSYRVHP